MIGDIGPTSGQRGRGVFSHIDSKSPKPMVVVYSARLALLRESVEDRKGRRECRDNWVMSFSPPRWYMRTDGRRMCFSCDGCCQRFVSVPLTRMADVLLGAKEKDG